MRRTERGSALVESIPVMMVLIVLACAAFTALYVMFARAWIEYQCEQALYCAAVGHFNCRGQLVEKVNDILPWGRTRARVSAFGSEWQADVDWNWDWAWDSDSERKWDGRHILKIHKRLTPQLMTGKRDLHW